MNNLQIIGVRENPSYLNKAIDYFTDKWGIDRNIYEDCIKNSITTNSPLPRWFLLLKDEHIIGSYGIITNDFNSRQDLFPWFCALYIDEQERGNEFGLKLLEHSKKQTKKLGFKKLYLCTDHIGYYEKYGWNYIGNCFHPRGEKSRIYASDI